MSDSEDSDASAPPRRTRGGGGGRPQRAAAVQTNKRLKVRVCGRHARILRGRCAGRAELRPGVSDRAAGHARKSRHTRASEQFRDTQRSLRSAFKQASCQRTHNTDSSLVHLCLPRSLVPVNHAMLTLPAHSATLRLVALQTHQHHVKQQHDLRMHRCIAFRVCVCACMCVFVYTQRQASDSGGDSAMDDDEGPGEDDEELARQLDREINGLRSRPRKVCVLARVCIGVRARLFVPHTSWEW